MRLHSPIYGPSSQTFYEFGDPGAICASAANMIYFLRCLYALFLTFEKTPDKDLKTSGRREEAPADVDGGEYDSKSSHADCESQL